LYISVIYGAIGIPPLLIGMFLQSASQILFAGSNMPGVSPIIPTVRDGQWGVTTPGYEAIFVPIAYAVIAFAVLLVSHEFAHGVLARVHGIKLKSTGLLTLGIIPIGAFVEPDEKDLEKRPSIEKMRVFSAGSFANLIVCAVAAFAMISLSLFFVSSDGVKVVSVLQNSSAKGIIENGTVLYSINDNPVRTSSSYLKAVSMLTVGGVANVTTDSGVYAVPVISDPEKEGVPFIGLAVENDIKATHGMDLGLLNFVWTALTWTILFNFNVALVNVLPLAPFDGWRMLKELMSVFRISPETSKKIIYAIVSVSLFLLLINALPLVNIGFDYLRSLAG
jgi:membrane-associated protease RseP (regulator of RpoE activity)